MKVRKYYWMKNQSRQENLMYIVLWGMLFVTPLISVYVRTVSNQSLTFDWQEVLMVWRLFGIYLLLFLVHNYLLAPLLIHQHRRVAYFVAVAAMLGLFTTYQCSHHPRRFEQRHHIINQQDLHTPHHDMEFEGPPPEERMDNQPMSDQAMPNRPHHRRHSEPPAVIGEHDIVAVIVLILMFAANLGSKLYLKNRRDQKKMAALEKENLGQQLAYLRYQINPHFFMNTLNNIHALVDIDPEKAKDTILELSKMMRFVLYEGNKQGVPLASEFDFIRNYITLMKLRYTDKVRISVDLPQEVPDRKLPPLMLITFIENAFKHGISYQHESFVDVQVTISDWPPAVGQKPIDKGQRLTFLCSNSKADKPNQEKGGVGLANVKQRLNLLYDNDFTLNIQDTPDTYNVELNIPLS